MKLVVGVAVAVVMASSTSFAARPKFYFQVRGVHVPAGAPAAQKDKAKTLLISELKKDPSVVMELGQPEPTGADLEKTLETRKLDGYELMLRIVKSSHAMKPPAPGKVYKTLMVDVEVAIDAQKIPSGQMALAGEGTASVGTEVKAFNEKEKQQLLGEAMTEAIKQAVAKSISKLGSAGKAVKSTRRKKK